ncbi:MAG: hypothetical protein FVQ80_11570 [Planctomycetes bacterium]|nr:hypothetical protein [Planctomycetota bacterium]
MGNEVMLNKEKQYHMLYFPEDMTEEMEKAYNLSLDIDSNFSKLFQLILDNIINICERIKKRGKNWRHYTWHLVCIDKETHEVLTKSPLVKYWSKKRGKKENKSKGTQKKS